MRPDIELVPLRRKMNCIIGLAKSRSRLHQRIEHRLQIERRAADDLEHVGGGGLLLQRFAQLTEQPRVLDGDDGLGGEVLNKVDLLVGESAWFLPVDNDRANKISVLEHWYRKQGSKAAELHGGDENWLAFNVALVRSNLWNVNHPL